MNIDDVYIAVYVVTLPERKVQHVSIEKEFFGRNEFEVHFVEAQTDEGGNLNMLETIRSIIYELVSEDDDVIVICQGTHMFSEYYERDLFLNQVITASSMGVEILLGGVSGFGNLVAINKGLLWVDAFLNSPFIVIYKRAFDLILSEEGSLINNADEFMSNFFSNKIIVYPFISTCYCLDKKADELNRLFALSENRIKDYLRIVNKYRLR